MSDARAPALDHVIEVLRGVIDPELRQDLVTLKMIDDVSITGSKVELTLALTTPACPKKDELAEAAKQAILQVPGVTEVEVNVAAGAAEQAAATGKRPVPGIANVVAVASGKGGVGKSAVAVNLASALVESGAKVGLMDGDIYGPSIPMMMGIKKRPMVSGERILPVRKHGMELMSIGFLIPSDSPVIWRGPLVSRTLEKLLHETEWSALDYLIVDMPPGTGDAQLTLAQQVVVAGAVIVTTPQDVAMADAVRGISMFQKVDVPILGVVENMAYYACPECGQRSSVFGRGTTVKMCEDHGVPFLGELPMDAAIREAGDAGKPVVRAEPDSAVAKAFRELASTVAAQLKAAALAGGEAEPAPQTDTGGAPGEGR